MSSTDSSASSGSAVLVDEALQSISAAPANCTVLIDGPSGSGKSTLADGILDAWTGSLRPTLVRLDDIYPGWNGLDAAIEHLRSKVLLPRRAGRKAAWQRYDWTTGEPAEWSAVDPSAPLIVEGCGALAAAHRTLSDVRIWLVAGEDIRKERALGRDGDIFRDHWDQWQTDWEVFQTRETPERWATVRLRSDD